jgi:hypothetical protein
MEQLYFSKENKKVITDNVMNALSSVMPKNTIDTIGVQNVILNNMKNIINVVDKNKVNTSNFKDVLGQINRHTVQTTIKQISSKEQTNLGALKFKRDTDMRSFNKGNPYGDRQTGLMAVDRPMVVSTTGGKDISKSLETIMAEREMLDNRLGMKKSVQPMQDAFSPPPQQQQQQLQPRQPATDSGFEGFSSNKDGFSDLSVFESTITNGVNVSEGNFESFDQRLKRMEMERSRIVAPPQQSPAEFKKMLSQTTPDDGQSFEQKYRQAYDNRTVEEKTFTLPEQSTVNNFSTPIETAPMALEAAPIARAPISQEPLAQISTTANDHSSINNYNVQRSVSFQEPLEIQIQPVESNKIGFNPQIEKSMDNYTNILNNIITKEKVIDDKLKELEMREQTFMQSVIKKKDMENLLNFEFQQIIIDTRSFEHSGMNAYLFNFNQPISNIGRIQIINISIPVLNYNIASKQYFEYSINGEEKSIHIPKGNYNINQLIDIINKRNVDNFILKLNPITDCLFIEHAKDKELKVKKNYVSKKLGLDSNTIGMRPYDLRIINYLTLYIKNILQENPVCRVNPNMFTPVDILFNESVQLKHLEIEFRDIDDIIVDFEGRHHLIEMRIFYDR